MMIPYLERTISFGPNQFAYREKRGARDALAFLVIEWIQQINRRGKVGVYASDVSRAFDRVSTSRIMAKLRAKGVHHRLLALIESWLQPRRAKVVVGGEYSAVFLLVNMLFQGTVLGPTLWNLFFEDSRVPINSVKFIEAVFADDLNAYRMYAGNVRNSTILRHSKECQTRLHAWGSANQVVFDETKESFW